MTQSNLREDNLLWAGILPQKQAGNYNWDKTQRESHLCRHREKQCRPGQLATVFCKELTLALPQLPPSLSNSQSVATRLQIHHHQLQGLPAPHSEQGQAKSLSLSEVDGTNLNADIKAKIVFNRQIKFFFVLLVKAESPSHSQ